jgi:hypothetical protein
VEGRGYDPVYDIILEFAWGTEENNNNSNKIQMRMVDFSCRI